MRVDCIGFGCRHSDARMRALLLLDPFGVQEDLLAPCVQLVFFLTPEWDMICCTATVGEMVRLEMSGETTLPSSLWRWGFAMFGCDVIEFGLWCLLGKGCVHTASVSIEIANPCLGVPVGPGCWFSGLSGPQRAVHWGRLALVCGSQALQLWHQLSVWQPLKVTQPIKGLEVVGQVQWCHKSHSGEIPLFLDPVACLRVDVAHHHGCTQFGAQLQGDGALEGKANVAAGAQGSLVAVNQGRDPQVTCCLLHGVLEQASNGGAATLLPDCGSSSGAWRGIA